MVVYSYVPTPSALRTGEVRTSIWICCRRNILRVDSHIGAKLEGFTVCKNSSHATLIGVSTRVYESAAQFVDAGSTYIARKSRAGFQVPMRANGSSWASNLCVRDGSSGCKAGCCTSWEREPMLHEVQNEQSPKRLGVDHVPAGAMRHILTTEQGEYMTAQTESLQGGASRQLSSIGCSPCSVASCKSHCFRLWVGLEMSPGL